MPPNDWTAPPSARERQLQAELNAAKQGLSDAHESIAKYRGERDTALAELTEIKAWLLEAALMLDDYVELVIAQAVDCGRESMAEKRYDRVALKARTLAKKLREVAT